MRLIFILAALAILCGCVSREDRGRTAADVWHIGNALEQGADQVPPQTLRLMGVTLKRVAIQWAESLDGKIQGAP